jgi:flagellar L-ring protein precursor FlgH
MKFAWPAVVIGGLCAGGFVQTARAQNSSLFQPEMQRSEYLPHAQPNWLTLPQASWTYVAMAPLKRIELHDPVVVRVDELARMTSDGEINRRKTSTYNAQLKDWVIWPSLFTIKPAPQSDGDQKINAQLQQQNRSTSELETRESLTLNMPCEIVDIRPNGLLVLEGHKSVGVDEEAWEVSLTGLCRREDIDANNQVLSKNVLNLKLDKRTRGQVRDGYKRGWFVRWFDQFDPF